MINLKEYILEKFKINSKTAKQGNALVKLFNLDNDEADYLYQYWDPKEPLFKFNDPICSPLEGLLMLAFMLVDDNKDFNFYYRLLLDYILIFIFYFFFFCFLSKLIFCLLRVPLFFCLWCFLTLLTFLPSFFFSTFLSLGASFFSK